MNVKVWFVTIFLEFSKKRKVDLMLIDGFFLGKGSMKDIFIQTLPQLSIPQITIKWLV